MWAIGAFAMKRVASAQVCHDISAAPVSAPDACFLGRSNAACILLFFDVVGRSP